MSHEPIETFTVEHDIPTGDTRRITRMPDDYEWEPDVRDDEEDPVRTAVFQAIGAASICWERVEEAGVFDSTLARTIGDGLMKFLEPHLAR